MYLFGLYSSKTIWDECQSHGQIFRFLAQKNLIETETKLLMLVPTVVATTASVAWSFSALKGFKTYSRKCTDQGHLHFHALI